MFEDAPLFLQEFLNYMSLIKNRSALTVKNYYYDLKLLFRYLKLTAGLCDDKETAFREIDIKDVSEDMVKRVTTLKLMEFLTYVKNSGDNERAAQVRKSVSIRQFFKYLTEVKGWFTVSPAQNLKLSAARQALPKYLTVEQATELLETTAEGDDWKDVRNYCIITFFLNCGMRLSELAAIDIDSCVTTRDYATGDTVHYLKVIGKGNKERIVYLNDACIDAYERWIKVRPQLKNTAALFVSKKHNRLSNRRIQQLVDEELKKAGLSGQGFSVHKLRHTAATLMYQNGVDIRVLKDVLGHENMDTTQIYTHVAVPQIQKAMTQNPLSNVKAGNIKAGEDEKES